MYPGGNPIKNKGYPANKTQKNDNNILNSKHTDLKQRPNQLANTSSVSMATNTAQIGCTSSPSESDATVNMPLDIANTNSVRLLVDTGSDISLLKYSCLKPGVPVDRSRTILLNGIYGGKGKTVGKCIGKFLLESEIKCEFQIVNDKDSIPFDGILGRDFLWDNTNIKCINRQLQICREKPTQKEIIIPFQKHIRFRNTSSKTHHVHSDPIDSACTPKVKTKELLNTKVSSEIIKQITIRTSVAETLSNVTRITKRTIKNVYTLFMKLVLKILTISMFHCQKQIPQNEIMHISQSQATDTTIKLRPRSETVITLPVDDCSQAKLCLAEEIRQGVFIGNALSEPKNGTIPVPIINTTNSKIILSNIHPKLHPLTDYEIHALQPNSIHSTQLDTGRFRKLDKEIDFANSLNEEERNSVRKLCQKYHDIFFFEGDKLTCTDTVYHDIPLLQNQAPINQRPYRLPEVRKQVVNEQVEQMLREGIITNSRSPWNSPLLVVPKKPGKDGEKRWRVVVDFRKLNEKTIGDAYPLPRIEEILDQLGNSRYFSTLDLASGYHQVPVDPKDREKTAFSTTFGHYEFTRMPFGLKGAPATFQRLMNYVLTGLQGIKCFVYLDDIVIYGKNLSDHNQKLEEVFERLRKYNLKLQPSKCQFLRKEVVYLGHTCSNKGCHPDPKKIECVLHYPIPRNIKQLQSFLGLANYYRKFIPNFSRIAEPLNKLLRKSETYTWTKQCDEAFNNLKEVLTTPPLLAYPDFSKPFLLTTDASNESLGAVLSQGTVGKDRPIAYASRTLNAAERRYSTIEKELLAIVWAVKNFRCYLLGRKFTVYSDHQPLKGVFNTKDPSSRLIRFHHKLSEYDYHIEYKPGRKNSNADALSRIPVNGAGILVTTRSQSKNRESLTEDNPGSNTEKPLSQDQSRGKDSMNKGKHKVVKTNDAIQCPGNPSEIKEILNTFHCNPLGGHQGVAKTYYRIKKQYRWPNMLKDVAEYIKKCPKCQKNKHSPEGRSPMVLTDTAHKPFDKVYLDIVGPLPVTHSGNKYILTFEDDLTRFMDCYAIPDCEAGTVAKTFYEEIITRYRIPGKVITDQGSNFMSELFSQLCKFLGIKKINTSAYHPQSNGALERSHRPLADYLRNFIDENPESWDQWLRQAVHVRNNTRHNATRLTPMDCLFGFSADLPTSLSKPPEPIYNHENYFNILKYKIRKTHQIARKNLMDSKRVTKRYYDRRTNQITYSIGDKILLKNPCRQNKFSPIWLGPYEIKDLKGTVNAVVQVGRNLKTIHYNRLKPFYN